MLFRFCLYGFLKNQRYFEPFLMLILLERDLNFLAIGWLTATREFTVNVFEVPSGALADLFGRRLSLALAFVAYIGSFSLLASAHAFPVLALAMGLLGLGDAFRSGTHKAMIFEWLRAEGRENERTKIYGLTRSWSKLGSAFSSLVAIGVVLMTGRFEVAFWMTIPCYVLNLVNVGTYPHELEARHETDAETRSVGAFRYVLDAVRDRRILRLIGESMGWEGVFHAIKDYLQPALQLVVTGYLAARLDLVARSPTESTALLTGLTYFGLFFLSAIASRQAYHLVTRCGSNERAARVLWIAFLVSLALIVGFALYGLYVALVCVFVGLHVLQNLWRPILISRFDEVGEPAKGATILSVEGQAHRVATMMLAPLVGWGVDLANAS